MGKEKIAELTLNIGKDGAKLVLIGPKVGPAQPSIGVLKDEKGNYHFAVGNKDSVVAPAKLPMQLKEALNKMNAGKNAAFSMAMPSCSDLKMPNGRYMRHHEYRNQRVSRMITPGQKVLWPTLDKQVYDAYIQLCGKLVKHLGQKV